MSFLPSLSPRKTQTHLQLKPFVLLGCLIIGYIGIYLCRKNLSVAVPLIQKEWELSKESIGLIASVSTMAYAAGKILLGPLVDRFGGRLSFLSSMTLVAIFGAFSASAGSLGALILLHSLNRTAGAAGWGAMIKQVPDWFGPSRLAFALGLLSLSFVFGGAIALFVAGLIAQFSEDNWRVIVGLPSAILLVITVICALVLPSKNNHLLSSSHVVDKKCDSAGQIWALLYESQFLITCGLSFILTFIRETLNFWTVDLVKTEANQAVSSSVAAFLSMPFDVFGGLGIMFTGWVFTRLSNRSRTLFLFGNLLLLSLLLFCMPYVFSAGLWLMTAALGFIGFLVYGPYSLLGGILSVEVRGKEYAATVSGWVDGTGYLAGLFSGIVFGKLLGMGGYQLGFQCMAGFTVIAAFLCLYLYPKSKLTYRESYAV